MPQIDPRDTLPLDLDYEQLPAGHYRGRGTRQEGTGPSGRWLERGPGRFMVAEAHRSEGRAPKNFTRSDERLRDEVCEALALHADFDVSDIEVDVTDGEVTLRGRVRSRWAKLYAEDLAAGILGVRDVMNELRIAPRPEKGGRGPTSAP